MKTDYAVRLQQEGHLRQGLLSGLWCEPQWGAGFRVELLREKGIGVSEGGGHRDLADDRCGVVEEGNKRHSPLFVQSTIIYGQGNFISKFFLLFLSSTERMFLS